MKRNEMKLKSLPELCRPPLRRLSNRRFVSSNVSVIACENKYLRAATKQSMGKFALTKNILPELRKHSRLKSVP